MIRRRSEGLSFRQAKAGAGLVLAEAFTSFRKPLLQQLINLHRN